MKRERVRAIGLALVMLLVLAAALGPMSSRAADRYRPLTDFNADGYEDLAVGVPYEDLELVGDTVYRVGSVAVFHGSAPDGLSAASASEYSQRRSEWSVDPAEYHDSFGWALAVGDFDGDGYTDLAVGVPGQDVGGESAAGAVHVFYGAPGYLSYARNEVWDQDTGSVGSIAEGGDGFGEVLAAGDFDGDGCDDLAVGVPFENWNERGAGIVQILYGSAGGLTDEGNDLWRQGANGIPDGEEEEDLFGRALVTADFDGDGYADLAVGVPNEDLDLGDPPSTRYSTGVVHVLYGSPFGLSPTDNELWHQDVLGTEDEAEDGDEFGFALTAGDFDGDGQPELAVGVPGQRVGSADGTGAVHILPVRRNVGYTIITDEVLDQDDLDLGGSESDDRFGDALTAGDFDGDGYADLAVGVPQEGVGGSSFAGRVCVLYGAPGGPSVPGFESIIQGFDSYEDQKEEGDRFGQVLAAGDFDGDGYADLAVGIPYEDAEAGSEAVSNAGAVQVVYGSGSGLTSADDQFWDQSALYCETPEAGDWFGYALAAIPEVRPRMIHLPLVLRNAR